MLLPERLEEMQQAIRRYGSGNCWTGTTGELSKMIHELMRERLDLIDCINEVCGCVNNDCGSAE